MAVLYHLDRLQWRLCTDCVLLLCKTPPPNSAIPSLGASILLTTHVTLATAFSVSRTASPTIHGGGASFSTSLTTNRTFPLISTPITGSSIVSPKVIQAPPSAAHSLLLLLFPPSHNIPFATTDILQPETAARSLEDLDRYFRESPPIIVSGDKTVTSSKRPDAYIEHEQSEVRRHSSLAPAEMSKAAEAVRNVQLEKMRSREEGGEHVENGEVEKM